MTPDRYLVTSHDPRQGRTVVMFFDTYSAARAKMLTLHDMGMDVYLSVLDDFRRA